MSKHGVRVAASFPRQLQYIVFSSPVDSTDNSSHSPSNDKPENISEGGRTHETLQWTCGLLPEEDVPEKQPAWINQQGYEWVD